MAIDTLSEGFDDIDTLTVIAEFNIKHKFWDEAATLLCRIDRLAEPDAARSQKIGFCMENKGELTRAISYYEEARLLGGTGTWLLRHIAATYRAMGQPSQAIAALRELIDSAPDDINANFNLGMAYLESRRPAEALQQFYKTDYLAHDSMKVRRALAWALFLNRKNDEAAKVYDEIIATGPAAEDYLNAGHNARATGNMREAINFYKLSMETAGQSVDELDRNLQADTPWLAQGGVDTSTDRLVIEAILYDVNNRK